MELLVILFLYKLKNTYQNILQSMKGSDFFFDYVQLLYKINVIK